MYLRDLYQFRPALYEGKPHKWDSMFGVELEIERHNAMPGILGWVPHNDGSLRQGIEWVTERPIGGSELAKAVDAFYAAPMTYTNGPRTSTHIHVTAGDMTVDNLRVMIAVVHTIEDGLFSAIGETRKWSGYAMPISEMALSRLRKIMSATDQHVLHSSISPTRNQERYYGLNTGVRKHGTVEFRYFPGGPSKEELCNWIDLIASIKRMCLAVTVENLLQVRTAPAMVELFRRWLPREWVDKLLHHSPSDVMFQRYEDILAMTEADDKLELEQTLVYCTPALLNFLEKREILSKEGAEYLRTVAVRAPVLGLMDWMRYAGEARRRSPVARAAVAEEAEEPAPDRDYGFDPVPVPRRAPRLPDLALDPLRNNYTEQAIATAQRRIREYTANTEQVRLQRTVMQNRTAAYDQWVRPTQDGEE